MKTTHAQKIKTSAMLCLLAGAAAMNANAQNAYFDVNGATAGYGTTAAGVYNWDDPNWGISGGTGTTVAWTPGTFARFYGPNNYTVNVNAAESMAGMYDDNTSTANVLTIQDAGNNTGSLSVVANTSQASQNGFSWVTQGFLTAANTVSITAPITGSGGVEEESGGGHLQMYGNNSFTGGYLVTSSSTFNDFNNNNSFGAVTSQIGFDGTTFAIMNNTGSSSVNIANPMQTIGTTGIDFIGNSVTYSGGLYMGGGSSAINIRNNGVGTTVTLSGALSGTSGNVTFSGANGGTILLSGANSYTGGTIIGSSGDTAIILAAGANNVFANSAKITLSGGTLAMNGYNQTTMATMALTASSTISFMTGTELLSIANSSGVAWTGGQILNLSGYAMNNDGTSDGDFFVGTGGLTSAQLAEIEVNGGDLGQAFINSGGFVEVPEPSTIALGALGGLALLLIKRRQTT